jgi:hypothetical protein
MFLYKYHIYSELDILEYYDFDPLIRETYEHSKKKKTWEIILRTQVNWTYTVSKTVKCGEQTNMSYELPTVAVKLLNLLHCIFVQDRVDKYWFFSWPDMNVHIFNSNKIM